MTKGPRTESPINDPTMVQPQLGRVVVVGLGLMGGSLLHAMKRTGTASHTTGVDRAEVAAVALAEGLIDEARLIDDAEQQLAQADLVVLCLPVLGIMRFLDDNRRALAQGPTITDMGSTKVAIAERARNLRLNRFVGGHPMTGKPESGFDHADAGLFVGATWFLCTDATTEPDALQRCRQFVTRVGAKPVQMDAQEHDRAVAMTSHLPHLLSNLLAELVLDHAALEAGGGSLREILQVAGAPHAIWQDTIATNRSRAAEGLRDFAKRAADLATALEAEELDHDRLIDLFARGRACRDRLGARVHKAPPDGDA